MLTNRICQSGLFFLMLSIFSTLVIAESQPNETVFSTKSFWYVVIPKDVTLNDNSNVFVAEFLRQKNAYYGTVGISTKNYSSPVYFVDKNTPTTNVLEWNCQNKKFKDGSLAEQWAAVRIPVNALAANGTDAEMSIYEKDTDTLWEFWKARRVDGQWQACWGGRILDASKSDGIFNKYYGTTATSLPFLGGQITAEELQQGEIKHVIGISLVDIESSKIFSWPAHRSDGFNPKNLPNRIPEGLRFRLDPTIDVDALKMHPVGKIIAKAAQKYGFVVWDKAGAISLRAQNSYSYTTLGQPDPYIRLFNGTPAYAILNGFPWEKLQFLPMDYGKPQTFSDGGNGRNTEDYK